MHKQSSDDFWSGTQSFGQGTSTDPSWLSVTTPSSGGRPGAENRPDYWQLDGMVKDPERGYYDFNNMHRKIKKNKIPKNKYNQNNEVDPIGESPRNPDIMHNYDYSSSDPYNGTNYSGIDITNNYKRDQNLLIVDEKRLNKKKKYLDPNDEVEDKRNKIKYQKQWYDVGDEVGMWGTLSHFDSGSYDENMNYSGIDHSASVIDINRQHLDLKIWEQDNNEYKIKKEIRKFILTKLYDTFIKSNLKSFVKWIKDIYIVGSIVSYKWINESDVDIHIITDKNKLNKFENYEGSLKDLTKKIRAFSKDIIIPNTKHVIEFTMVEHYENHPDAIYSLINNNWIQKPHKEENKNFQDMFEKAYAQAIQIIISISVILESIKLQLKDYKYYQELLNEDDTNKEKLNDTIITLQKSIIEDLNRVLKIYEKIKDSRQKAYNEDSDPAFSKANIIYKILEHYAYITLFKNIKVFIDMKNTNNQFKYIDKIINGKKGLIKQSHFTAPSVNPNSGPDRDNYSINNIYPYKTDYKPQEKDTNVYDRLKKIQPLYKKLKNTYDNRTIDPERQFEKYHDVNNYTGPTYVDRNWFGGSGTNILTQPSSCNGGWNAGWS